MVKAIKVLPETSYDVQITISSEAAGFLRDICGKIGGSPHGPRGHFDEIEKALFELGVQRISGYSSNGEIFFSDKKRA